MTLKSKPTIAVLTTLGGFWLASYLFFLPSGLMSVGHGQSPEPDYERSSPPAGRARWRETDAERDFAPDDHDHDLWAKASEPIYAPRHPSRDTPAPSPYLPALAESPPPPGEDARFPVRMRYSRKARVIWDTQMEKIPPEEFARDEQVAELRQKLQAAQDEAETAEVTEELLKVLEQQFDADFDRREDQLVELATRLQKLRQQLDKRKAAREEIIELRLKTLVHQAEGLSFPPSVTEPQNGPMSWPAALSPPAHDQMPGVSPYPAPHVIPPPAFPEQVPPLRPRRPQLPPSVRGVPGPAPDVYGVGPENE